MTTWYFDSINGSDLNSGTTTSAPKKSYDSFNLSSIQPGDSVLFYRGTPQIINTLFKGIKSGNSGAYVRYGTYGVAQVPYAIFTNPSAAGSIILNGANSHHIIVEDLFFDIGNNSQAIYFAAQGVTDTYSNIIRRCYFANSNLSSGLNISREDNATARAHDFLVEDCVAYNNGAHGFAGIGENITYRRCIAYENGSRSPEGGHGFSMRWNRTSKTSGWTNTTSTIYSIALGAAELDVTYVDVSGLYNKMAKNTSTPTTPSLGQFGVSAGTLYVNAGSSLNTRTTTYAWGRGGSILVEDCEAYNNRKNSLSPYWEGHGFAFDDFTEDSIFRRCYSHGNEGLGFSINKGNRNKILSSICHNNGLPGIVINPSDTHTIDHLTSFNNNTSTATYGNAEVVTSGSVQGVSVTNSVIIGTKQYGISISDPTNCVVDHNSVTGATTAVTGITATNTYTTNPLLNTSTGILGPNSPCIQSGIITTPGLLDYSRHRFSVKPTLGAIEMKRLATIAK